MRCNVQAASLIAPVPGIVKRLVAPEARRKLAVRARPCAIAAG
jgi:hypothetical protein